MNKLLLGTTALVGASLLMAGGAYAAKPKVKVNGGIKIELGGASQDLETHQDSVGLSTSGPTRGYALQTNSEVHINISGKTDAGMKWKARVEIEADTHVSANDAGDATESAIDETWVRFSGSWGQIRLGNEDGAEDLMHISSEGATKAAGAGGTDGHWDDFIGWREVNSRFANEPTLREDSSDATKITYFTPRVGGLQAGVSFTPDTGAGGQAHSNDNAGDLENSWGFGVNFKKKFGAVKIGIAGVAHIGDFEPEVVKKVEVASFTDINKGTGTVTTSVTDFEDLRAWMIGAEIHFGNWKLGGAYQNNGDGGEEVGNGDQDNTAWDVGIGYSSGPVILGLGYLHAEVEQGSDGEDTGDTVNFGATYMLGGGAKVFAEVFWFDIEAADDKTLNDGFGFIVGTAVKF